MSDDDQRPSAGIDAIIRQRRTIHAFRPETPPEAVVLECIELARWAPNHHRTEPWRFHLLGRETVRRIVDLNAELVTAKKGPDAGAAKRLRWSEVPGWLAVSYRTDPDPVRDREDYAACCCAVHNLSLALWARGVGVKWTTGDVTRDPRFFHLLDLDPAADHIVALLWYGYPDQVPEQERKPAEEIVRRHG